MAPAGPYRLVTVNTAPERAKRLIGRVVEDVKEQYTIIHAGNAATSMWTPEEARQIIAIAKELVPDLKTFSLPQGLQVERGPDAVVEYIKGNLPALLG
ncbi:hypothetical protein N0V88_002913 [Collariella sp. IMI 366227]|nr:hypothetical protein N0V88_002913 [Collariella sp. IMI 366227]